MRSGRERERKRGDGGGACCIALNERVISMAAIEQHAFPIGSLSGIVSIRWLHNGRAAFLARHLRGSLPL